MLSKFTQKQYETKTGKQSSSLKKQKTPAAKPTTTTSFVPASSPTTVEPSTSSTVNNLDVKAQPVQSTAPATNEPSSSLSSLDLREFRSHLQSLRFSVTNERLPVPDIYTPVPDHAYHTRPATRHPHMNYDPLISFIDAPVGSLLDAALRIVSYSPSYVGFASTTMSRLVFDHAAYTASIDLILEKLALVLRF
jgi:hypothetical protein